MESKCRNIIHLTLAGFLAELCKPLFFVFVSERSQLHHWVTARGGLGRTFKILAVFLTSPRRSLKKVASTSQRASLPADRVTGRPFEGRLSTDADEISWKCFIWCVVVTSALGLRIRRPSRRSAGEDLETEKRGTAMWRKRPPPQHRFNCINHSTVSFPFLFSPPTVSPSFTLFLRRR